MPAIDPRNIEAIDPEQAAVLRSKTMADRVAMIASANLAARAAIRGVLKACWRTQPDEVVDAEVVRRMAGGPARPVGPRR